jgi:hypothetical protein
MTKSTRHRNKNLDDLMIASIVEILDGWSSDKLTWNYLIDRVQMVARKRYTRQALSNHPRIKEAFSNRKTQLKKVSSVAVKNLTPDQERIVRLEAEVDRLKMENNNLLEQFHRWVYNGGIYGLSTKMRESMNYPLPQIYREPSSID